METNRAKDNLSGQKRKQSEKSDLVQTPVRKTRRQRDFDPLLMENWHYLFYWNGLCTDLMDD